MHAAIDRTREVLGYAYAVASGRHLAGGNIRECRRFLMDYRRAHSDDPALSYNHMPASVIACYMETFIRHHKGEDIDGKPLRGKPLRLLPWQLFIVYSLFAFFLPDGTNKYKEAFIFVPRKNGKTTFVAALAFGVSMYRRQTGAMCYIVAASLKQALESFRVLTESVDMTGIAKMCRILDNAAEHSLTLKVKGKDGKSGEMKIEALASNAKAHDSFNCNFGIADEIQAMKSSDEYDRISESMKAYSNKLMVGITTAGDNPNSFCYDLLRYAEQVLDGTIDKPDFFAFVSHARQSQNGDVRYMDPREHERANPSYGATIRPADMASAAQKAQDNARARQSFLSRSLNIYTNSSKAYFNVDEFRSSDRKYEWTLEELARMPIRWYGGADLSKLHDLTAACIYGNYDGVDIVISHAFFPLASATRKAREDRIPVFEWVEKDWCTCGLLPVTQVSQVVNWFSSMRDMGFDIAKIGHDPKFAGEEFFPQMQSAGFRMEPQLQVYYLKGRGFRRIERMAKSGTLYYLHCRAYEYCVGNVVAIEKVDDMPMYEKIRDTSRIDIFDASVFACVKYLEDASKPDNSRWFEKR